MAILTNVQRYGSQLVIIFDDNSRILAYASSKKLWLVHKSTANKNNVTNVKKYGNELVVCFDDGSKVLCYSAGNVWKPVSNVGTGVIITKPIDTILPGHHCNIGTGTGTVTESWAYHVATANGRGGVDLNYSYGSTFRAPADGTVNTFDVSGVGMIVQLVLNNSATRTLGPEPSNDSYGPMVAMFFEHCSNGLASGTAVKQNDYIGASGDGYGTYPAHLHVHGMVDLSHTATSSNRCQFWDFL